MSKRTPAGVTDPTAPARLDALIEAYFHRNPSQLYNIARSFPGFYDKLLNNSDVNRYVLSQPATGFSREGVLRIFSFVRLNDARRIDERRDANGDTLTTEDDPGAVIGYGFVTIDVYSISDRGYPMRFNIGNPDNDSYISLYDFDREINKEWASFREAQRAEQGVYPFGGDSLVVSGLFFNASKNVYELFVTRGNDSSAGKAAEYAKLLTDQEALLLPRNVHLWGNDRHGTAFETLARENRLSTSTSTSSSEKVKFRWA